MLTSIPRQLTLSRYFLSPVRWVRYWNSRCRDPNSAKIELPPEAHPQFFIAPLEGNGKREGGREGGREGEKEREGELCYNVLLSTCMENLQAEMLHKCIISPVGRDGRPPTQSNIIGYFERRGSLVHTIFHVMEKGGREEGREVLCHREKGGERGREEREEGRGGEGRGGREGGKEVLHMS